MALNLTTIPVTVSTGTGSGTVVGTSSHGFRKYDYFMVDATLVNTDTTATLDVYVQRNIVVPEGTGNVSLWRDWCHFPQLAASAGTKQYSVPASPSPAIYSVGTGTDGTYASCATPALAANTFVGGHPGDSLRVVSVKSVVGDATDQTQTVRITCWQGQD